MQLQINQKFKELIPALSQDEFAQLEANILAEGVREPILVARYPNEDGEECQHIADGHNRYEIATKHGLTYPVNYIEFDGETEVIIWMINNQFGRRNLTDFVKLELAQVKREILRVKGLDEMKKAGEIGRANRWGLSIIDKPQKKAQPHNTRKEIATELGWSENKVARGEIVLKKAPEELKQQVRAGEVSINQAYQEIKKEEKVKQLEQKKERLSKIENSLPKSESDFQFDPIYGKWYKIGNNYLYYGDSSDPGFISQLPKSAFAFADPPYNAGVDYWDSGFVWGHDYLQDVADIVVVTPGISEVANFFDITKMNYKWAHSTHITNGMKRGALGFGNFILSLIFSSKSSIHRNSQDISSISISNSASDEHYHKGKKPDRYMINMVDLFSTKGDIVIDPFLGSGTTLFICQESNRVCFGAEKEKEYFVKIIKKFMSKWPELNLQQQTPLSAI